MTNIPLFFIDQHGCAKNQVDGELIVARLVSMGWARTDIPEESRLIIINSCGFIESAKKESIDAVLAAHSAYPQAKILLAGCLAERYSADLVDGLPEADGFFGNGDLSRLNEVVATLFQNERPVLVPPQMGVCAGERQELLSFPGTAYVKITEGCNNCCSFCAIPLIRGNLRSRAICDVVDEVKNLLSRDILEINLIGQDLASYGCETDFEKSCEKITAQGVSPLAQLLQALDTLDGDFWVRLLYIHPDNFPSDILPIIKNSKHILPYFDLPFQAGDTAILKAMNRRGSSEQYIELINSIRDSLPDLVLRTTFLVGFPGESEKAFDNTAAFLQKIEPDWSGCFTYSSEDGTPAALLKQKTAKKELVRRKNLLESIQSEITERRLAKHIGKEYQVLVEEILPPPDECDDDTASTTGFAIGRAWFQAPEVDGAVVIRYDADDSFSAFLVPGKMVSVRVTGCTGVDLDSVLINESRV